MVKEELVIKIKKLYKQKVRIAYVLKHIFCTDSTDGGRLMNFHTYAKFFDELGFIKSSSARIPFNTYDKDEDNEINYMEFTESILSTETEIIINDIDETDSVKYKKLLCMLKKYYTDANVLGKELEIIFNEEDKDNDGYIDAKEFANALMIISDTDSTVAQVLFDNTKEKNNQLNILEFIQIIKSTEYFITSNQDYCNNKCGSDSWCFFKCIWGV